MINELLLSDDELDLIWCLPYITEKERLKAIVAAQLEKALESLPFRKVKSQEINQNIREWWNRAEQRIPAMG